VVADEALIASNAAVGPPCSACTSDTNTGSTTTITATVETASSPGGSPPLSLRSARGLDTPRGAGQQLPSSSSSVHHHRYGRRRLAKLPIFCERRPGAAFGDDARSVPLPDRGAVLIGQWGADGYDSRTSRRAARARAKTVE
jgi:hypothetical protein